MDLLIEITKFLIYSIFIVLIAKYALVKILRKLGELLELKPKVIGNIAGIATSIPELLTVSFSALTGLITTSTYNIISSNIINLVQYSLSVVLQKNQNVLRNKAIQIDLGLVGLTIFIPIIMIIFKVEQHLILVPLFMILFILCYKVSNNAHKLYMQEKKYKTPEEQEQEDRDQEDELASQAKVEGQTISKLEIDAQTEKTQKQALQDAKLAPMYKRYLTVTMYVIVLLIIGIALYIIGNLLSEVLENLCNRFHVPEMMIGILLGFITSLPELITFFESQKHHQDEKEGVTEATSNLLTSNIMNLFIIQSIGIIIYRLAS